jgi:hypothetical protein
MRIFLAAFLLLTFLGFNAYGAESAKNEEASFILAVGADSQQPLTTSSLSDQTKEAGFASGHEKKNCLVEENGAVNCGLGVTCPDGYHCCKGTAKFICCKNGKSCDDFDNCIDSN